MPRLDGHAVGRGVDVFDGVHRIEREQYPIRHRRGGERVPGADRLDPSTGSTGVGDDRRHLVGARRSLEQPRGHTSGSCAQLRTVVVCGHPPRDHAGDGSARPRSRPAGATAIGGQVSAVRLSTRRRVIHRRDRQRDIAEPRVQPWASAVASNLQPDSVDRRVLDDQSDHRRAEAVALMFVEHVHVGQPGERRQVGHHACEPDLRGTLGDIEIGADHEQAVGDRRHLHVERAATRPVRRLAEVAGVPRRRRPGTGRCSARTARIAARSHCVPRRTSCGGDHAARKPVHHRPDPAGAPAVTPVPLPDADCARHVSPRLPRLVRVDGDRRRQRSPARRRSSSAATLSTRTARVSCAPRSTGSSTACTAPTASSTRCAAPGRRAAASSSRSRGTTRSPRSPAACTT